MLRLSSYGFQIEETKLLPSTATTQTETAATTTI
jgi:hypothetical protein